MNAQRQQALSVSSSFTPVPSGLLQRKCACGNHAMGGGCEECRKRKRSGLQPKLQVNQPGDFYEQEADRIADQVMGASTHPIVGGATPRVQRLLGPPTGQMDDTAPASVDQALASLGRPLEPMLRQDMEQRFGYDFSRVRVHSGAAAEQSVRDVNANAYTVGSDMVFRADRFTPGTHEGRRLIAHELAHVVQQSTGESVRMSQNGGQRSLFRNNTAEHYAEPLHTDEALRITGGTLGLSRRVAREATTTVEAPASPPGCVLDQHRAIEPAVRGAQERLRRVIERVDAYISAPADAANRAVRDALDRHFHRTDPVVAGHVRARLATIRTDMTARTPFSVECHDATDTSCGNTSAYVRNTNSLVFCPEFFEGSSDFRIGAVIHEMAHALTGLNISDRAYSTDRLLPYLSTAEALDNAESYEMFSSEVESGRAVRGSPPRDEIEDCSERTQPLIREAIARAQRWNRDAETVANDQRPAMIATSAPLFTTHLGDATPATRSAARRVFGNMVERLGSEIDVRCDNEPTPECSNTRRAYKATASNIWRGLRAGAGIGGLVGLGIGLGAGLGAVFGGAGLLTGLGLLGLGALIGLGVGSLIGLIVGAVTRHPEVHVCPNWASLPTVEDRTESLLAAIYESYADLDAQRSRQYAALARAIHATWWTAPPPV